jgi:hypothetical protein
MLNLSRPSSVLNIFFSLLVSMAGSAAIGQTTTQNTALDRQLSRLDLGVIAVAVLNKDSNGTATVNGVSNTPVNLNPSNTVGPVVTLRYVVSPLVGFELNYGYARYTQTFTPFGALSNAGVQQNASEYTAGYVAHTRKEYFGVTPFASVGLGTIAFRPTPGGGEGLINQARAAYYYSVGAEKIVFSPHFGLRAQYRQLFFLAPDFETNYLTIKQHTSTYEPGFGFYVKF